MPIKTLTAAALALGLSLPALAAPDDFGPLLTPQELSNLQGESAPLILDIRWMKEYGAGHITNAVNAPYPLFRGPADNPGQVPDEDRLTEVLRALGVTKEQPVVVVHQGSDETDFGAAARVYWTLKSSGVSHLAILNGGVEGWKAAGLNLDKQPVLPEPSNITVQLSDQWLADAEDVQAVVDGRDHALLLDARPESSWKGEDMHPAAARPGTLPQSKYLTHTDWFSNGPIIADADAAHKLALAEGLDDAQEVVSFCNTGHWAATNWFALSELAGIENVKLYPESMVGWSQAGGEMENVPGPIRNLWNQVKSIF
ncbi:sulfurtransferase [Pontibaca sp. S1109L]|uniref:Sulfurtransferase n=2 Tax=Pontibaca salina TaxID=2795731 RepID=A0A934M269_9RHOB|nr:sulfurtransferase [Pontibaca salina]